MAKKIVRDVFIKDLKGILKISKVSICARADALSIGKNYTLVGGVSYRVFSELEAEEIIHYERKNKKD